MALDPGAPERIESVAAVTAGRRLAVLVGAEGNGLSEAARAAATHRVRIPMAAGVDSLNVATALAIALHRLIAPLLTPSPPSGGCGSALVGSRALRVWL